MTPTEKAKEIIDKFRLQILQREYTVGTSMIIPLAKQCAIICVEEMIAVCEDNKYEYLIEVLTAIEKY